jgi:hypothetical protein
MAGLRNINSSQVVKPLSAIALNSRDGSKTAINGSTGVQQHGATSTDQAGSRAGSQDAGASGDQIQKGSSPQDQGTAPVQMNFPDHSATVISHTQGSDNGSLPQSIQGNAASTGLAGRSPIDTAPVTTVAPQALPVINTARLIQSIGQSEMRVGMRSNEFGNISINTSATRNLISAQISVDHGELAKAIAANLPDIQAKLGGSQALDVRVDLNGAGFGQGTGAFSSMQNGTADQSRNGGGQEGKLASGHAGNGLADRQFPRAAAVMTTREGSLNGRLDIRV